MHRFSPSNPIPLWQYGEFTYAEAQAHAADVDDWLGLKIEKIENELSVAGCKRRAPQAHFERQQLWIGLAAKSLLTPYTEIRRIIEVLNLSDGSLIVDLGAAYGRMGFVIGKYYPDLNFVGYEYVGERVTEANRCLSKHGIKNARVEHADLSSPLIKLVQADVYFIYDYGTEKAIEKTLFDLKRLSAVRPIRIVVRGKACHEAITKRHAWLNLDLASGPESKSSIFSSPPCTRQSASLNSPANL